MPLKRSTTTRRTPRPTTARLGSRTETAFSAIPDTESNLAQQRAMGLRGAPLNAHAATGDEVALANQIRQLFFRARAHRRALVAEWNKNHRIMENRTWAQGRAPWLPSPEVPEVYPIVETLVGWMTDQRPSLDIIPAANAHSPFHDFMSKISQDLKVTLDSTWQVHQYERQISMSVWDTFLCGAGILKSNWDTSLDGGMGNAKLSRVDPYTFYPDPAAHDLLDGNYYLEVRTMSLQELDRRFPGSSKRLADGAYIEDVDVAPEPLVSDSGTVPRANPAAITGGTPRYGLPGQSRIHATDDLGVTVFEAWLRQHEAWTDDEGDEHVFDTWRVVVVAGNCIIMDEDATELWGHGGHPYDRYVPVETGHFWTTPLVSRLRSCQLSINRLLAALQQNVELTGNPVFKESTRAGISRTKITNRPGQRVPVQDGGTAEWLDPPTASPQAMELINYYIDRMEKISGLTAIVRGASMTGRNAQGTVDAIQEGAFVRIRLSLRNLEWALRSSGEKLASLIAENYTSTRMVAIVGESGEDTALFLKPRHFYLPSEDGSAPMRFQMIVQAGSTMPTSRQQRAQEADVLYAMGALDIVGVLEAHDYPNRQEIARRVLEQQALGAQPPGARQRTQRTS
jgi:hypothetical protein